MPSRQNTIIPRFNRIKHGKSYTRIYQCWADMLGRCRNRKHKCFKDYGGRGIAVLEEWRRFEPFFDYMGPGKKGWSIHRVDNDVGYFPGNLVWALPKFQSRHTRRNI